MSYGEVKQWPQWLVRVEKGEIVEKRVFESAADVPAGWITKDAFRAGNQPVMAKEPEQDLSTVAMKSESPADDPKPARRSRKMSE